MSGEGYSSLCFQNTFEQGRKFLGGGWESRENNWGKRKKPEQPEMNQSETIVWEKRAELRAKSLKLIPSEDLGMGSRWGVFAV